MPKTSLKRTCRCCRMDSVRTEKSVTSDYYQKGEEMGLKEGEAYNLNLTHSPHHHKRLHHPQKPFLVNAGPGEQHLQLLVGKQTDGSGSFPG